MIYLTYDEYKAIGGTVVDLTAFNRNIDRACGMIDVRTQSRLERFVDIPKIVKVVCADLVDYISINTVDKGISSISQSAGGVSESVTYTIKTTEEYSADLDRIFEPLSVVKTENGTSIMYRGAMD